MRKIGIAACSVILSLSILVGGRVSAQEPTPTPSFQFAEGEITLKVPDYEATHRKLLEETKQFGGTVREARTEVARDGRKHGWIRLSVPTERFPEFRAVLRTFGILYSEQVSSHDDTSDYEGLARRTDRLKQHAARLDSLLQDRRRLRGSDILYVQDRLFRAEVDESALEQQRADMVHESGVSTIQVGLFEPVYLRKSDRARINLQAHFKSAQENAGRRWDQLIGRTTTVAAYSLVFAPVWVPILIVFLVCLRLLWRYGRPLVLRGIRAIGETSILLRGIVEDWLARRAAVSTEAHAEEATLP